MGGHMDGCKHNLLGWSRESSSPGAHHFSRITFLPTLPQGEVRNPSFLEPERPHVLLTIFRGRPLPQVSPFPRVSLSLLGCPTSGSPSLSGGPYPCPPGHRRLPRALTHPAKGRSTGPSAAAASSHRADPHSLPSWPSGLHPLSFL